MRSRPDVSRLTPAPQQALSRTTCSLVVSLSLLTWLLTLAACSGSSSTKSGRFTLVSTNELREGSIWALNRPIELTFSEAVDLESANLGTVQIFETNTLNAATGQFYLKPGSEDHTLVFQPNCPTDRFFTNGGLKPASRYRLALPTGGPGTLSTLRSRSGKKLTLAVTREFLTPASLPEYFYDPIPGAPARIETIHLGTRQAFPDPLTGGEPTAPLSISINRFTDPIEPLLVQFDQPLYPSATNVSGSTLSLTFETPTGSRARIPTTVTLIENCGRSGALVLISPRGILPSDTEITFTVHRDLEDIGGERSSIDAMPLRLLPDAAASEELDAFTEEFVDREFEESLALFAEPRARWADGELKPGTPFPGNNTDFIWDVRQNIFIDTSFDIITSPGNTQTMVITNGIVDVKDLHLRAGASIRGIGPNPLTILATGTVTIDGLITVSGVSADGVITLCTAWIPEPGAAGICSSGKGGDASWETTSSTPFGGYGNGPGNTRDGGGRAARVAMGIATARSVWVTALQVAAGERWARWGQLGSTAAPRRSAPSVDVHRPEAAPQDPLPSRIRIPRTTSSACARIPRRVR